MTRAINTVMNKMNTKQFIHRAQKIHGNYYDYSFSEYVSYRTPVSIVCPTHGKFKQLPSNHLKGSGCRQCSHQNKTSNMDDFIAKSKSVHQDKYDYSQVVITGMNDKVTIICPNHGSFDQRAASHLEGRGCLKCSGKQKSNTENFIEKAQIKHDDKYDYSLVNYKKSGNKTTIVCPVHGSFEQTPSDHLYGYGCPSCANNTPKSKETFILQAAEIHEQYYDYSKLSVNGMNSKGTITCPKHGDFEQRLSDHLNGSGCPICCRAKQGGYCNTFFEKNPEAKYKQAKIYLISSNDSFCKIGITTKDFVKQRFSGFQYNIVYEQNLSLYHAYNKEQEILNKFNTSRFKVKDFKEMNWQTGWTECFPIELLEDLKEEIERK